MAIVDYHQTGPHLEYHAVRGTLSMALRCGQDYNEYATYLSPEKRF
jgi:hypothetical protein